MRLRSTVFVRLREKGGVDRLRRQRPFRYESMPYTSMTKAPVPGRYLRSRYVPCLAQERDIVFVVVVNTAVVVPTMERSSAVRTAFGHGGLSKQTYPAYSKKRMLPFA